MLRTLLSLSLATTLAVSTLSAQTTATSPATKVAAKKPEPNYPKLPHESGWARFDEFILWPLHKEPHFVLKATAEALRNGDETKAAREIQRAIAWLRMTEAHALPEGKKELTEAIGKLSQVEVDLKKDDVVDAAKAANAIGSAYYAIANDHYLKAKENQTGTTADRESNMGAKHLIASGLYLQEAARLANTEFSKNIDESLKALIGYDHPETEAEAKQYGNVLAMHLKQVGDGLQQLGAELQQP